MGFPINPPGTALIDSAGRATPEFFRFLLAIQETIGGPSDPFADMGFLAPSRAQPDTAPHQDLPAPLAQPEPAPENFLPPSAHPVAYAMLADHKAETDPHVQYAKLAGATFTGALLNSAGGLGYTAGAGGTVTQSTNKSTAVTLDELTGEITTDNDALGSDNIVSFTLNNSTIVATDLIATAHHSGGTIGAYTVNGRATGAGTAQITLRNNTGGSLSQALVIKFAVIRGATT